MGTHPNTHCCHAVLDVLFICWIPAQSRSHAFPRALSRPPNTPSPFLPPTNATVTHARARTFQSRQMSPQRLQGARLCVSPRRLLHCWVSFWGSSVSPPLLLHAFSPMRLPSFQPCLLFGIPCFPTGFLSLFPFPVPLPLLPSLSVSPASSTHPLLSASTHTAPCSAGLRHCLASETATLDLPPFPSSGSTPAPSPVGSQPCLPRRCAHREAPAGCCPFTASKSPTPSHPQLGNYCWGKVHSGAR